MKYKKCPFCGEKVVGDKSNMVDHVNKYHNEQIPPGKTAGEAVYLEEHNGIGRKCMMCANTTSWNDSTLKYNAFCCEACKAKYVKMVRARMKKVYGKENLLDDPDHQKKMLEHRRISGVYKHTDGGEWKYTGSYEEDFCRMNDTFLNIPSADIMMPSPNVYHYKYKGEDKFYFPDAFIPSIGLEIEIKDGGNNPNNHHKIQDVDKVKERLKDEVLYKQKKFHYIKIENKEYEEYFKLMRRIRDGELTPMEETRKVKIIPKH